MFLGMSIPTTTFSDAFVPPPGSVRHYLVRAGNEDGKGGWGTDSSGTARLTADGDGDTIDGSKAGDVTWIDFPVDGLSRALRVTLRNRVVESIQRLR